MSAELTGTGEVTTLDDDPVLDDEALTGDDAELGDGADPTAEVSVFDVGEEPAPDDEAVPARRPSRREVRQEVRLSARRVRRVVRRIDPWSTFKVSALFSLCTWAVVTLAALLLWRAAVQAGSVDNIEDFVTDLGWKHFEFHPDDMFRALLIGGAVMTAAITFFTVLGTILFNLICDLTGGIRITMVEQDVADAHRKRPRRDPLAKKG